MNEFDKIIGYSALKKELKRIADILRNPEEYAKLGVKPPQGMLLHGKPGLGKTLMASCLMKESGRSTFVCRKDLPDGEFVNAIRETFAKAKEAAPSVILLDDMDKFANEDPFHKAAEEYVTAQSGFDEIKGCDVFVLATANSLDNLPDSLLRAGRFDRIQELYPPHGEDALAIIKHFMADKPFVAAVDADLVARLMRGRSCAELETVINEAGLYAGFDRSEVIMERHFLRACMRVVYEVPSEAMEQLGSSCGATKKLVAYHEAGHAVVQEVLEPGSVSLLSIYRDRKYFGGVTSSDDSDDLWPLETMENDIVVSLGGKAATEEVFGVTDVGAGRDIRHAFAKEEALVTKSCVAGLHLYGSYEVSAQLKYQQEMAVAAEVDRHYRKAREIIGKNRPLLDRIAAELMEKDVLTMFDIARIKAGIS